MNTLKEYWLFISIAIVTVVLLVAGGIAYAKASDEFKANCEAMGGHTDTKTQTTQVYGSYVGPNGQMTTGYHTASTTTTYCIGNNGEGVMDFM